nr:MAG TPA: Major head protein [Caudoviricetes sp.]
MTREQAKQKLISFGVAEPTDEQISDLLNSINAETKKEKDRADGYKAKADKADELQSQIDEINSQNMTEVEKATTALEVANKKIAELEKKDTVRTQRANAMEKFGITAEQASKVVTDDGATDYEVLGQIFADSKKSAIAEYEKQKLDDTPNPGGSTGGSGEEKTNAEKLVEKYYSVQKQNNDVLSHYVGGN